jgi:putative membrane protein
MLQMNRIRRTKSFLPLIFLQQGRALDNILLPWILVTMNATIWTCIVKLYHNDWVEDTDNWEFFIGIVLNTSLSFLLVFRLNRAASRFWSARECWGTIVGATRHFVSGIQTQADQDAKNQRLAVMWVVAFAIATMQYMRSSEHIPPDMLLGILDPADVKLMEMSLHPPLYAADKVRAALKEVFRVTSETPTALAIARTQQMNTLERTLNNIMDQEAAMERIRSTPLPLVYVAHLRIFLLIFLLSLPYVWVSAFGWYTIPVVFLSGFALLGLEGIAIEAEAPFGRGRSNHLNMDGFCLMIMQTIQQTIRDAADSEIAKKVTDDVAGDVETEDQKEDSRE